MNQPLTISVNLNREAIIHLLKYIRGIYLIKHTEDGEWIEENKCPYCLSVLIQLAKSLDDISIQEKLEELRIFAKERKKQLQQAENITEDAPV